MVRSHAPRSAGSVRTRCSVAVSWQSKRAKTSTWRSRAKLVICGTSAPSTAPETRLHSKYVAWIVPDLRVVGLEVLERRARRGEHERVQRTGRRRRGVGRHGQRARGRRDVAAGVDGGDGERVGLVDRQPRDRHPGRRDLAQREAVAEHAVAGDRRRAGVCGPPGERHGRGRDRDGAQAGRRLRCLPRRCRADRRGGRAAAAGVHRADRQTLRRARQHPDRHARAAHAAQRMAVALDAVEVDARATRAGGGPAHDRAAPGDRDPEVPGATGPRPVGPRHGRGGRRAPGADRHHGHGGRERDRRTPPSHPYSTVTVLARLRGWSTFSPRATASS